MAHKPAPRRKATAPAEYFPHPDDIEEGGEDLEMDPVGAEIFPHGFLANLTEFGENSSGWVIYDPCDGEVVLASGVEPTFDAAWETMLFLLGELI